MMISGKNKFRIADFRTFARDWPRDMVSPQPYERAVRNPAKKIKEGNADVEG
jgi:hypothetical protein